MPSKPPRNRRRRWLFSLLGLLLLGLLALFALFPARWLQGPLQARLHGLSLQGLHGSIWRGGASQLFDPLGRPLGRLDWQLSPLSLFGRPALALRLDGPQLQLDTQAHRESPTRWRIERLQATLDLAWLDGRLSLASAPRGSLHVQLADGVLEAGLPQSLRAQGDWNEASVRGHDGRPVALGRLHFEISGQGGIFNGHVADDGRGPLQLAGQLDASVLAWHAQATLAPRGDDPALRHWLAGLGHASADGQWHLERRGGLAAALPTNSPITTEPR